MALSMIIIIDEVIPLALEPPAPTPLRRVRAPRPNANPPTTKSQHGERARGLGGAGSVSPWRVRWAKNSMLADSLLSSFALASLEPPVLVINYERPRIRDRASHRIWIMGDNDSYFASASPCAARPCCRSLRSRFLAQLGAPLALSLRPIFVIKFKFA